MNAVGAPSARHSHFATWTGKEMIVWGGQAGTGGVSERATGGGVYDPSADSWRPLTEPDGATRTAAAVTWTGDSLWVWGGSQGGELVRSGFLYQPASGESRVIATDVQEAAVNDADAVATNGVVLLTGGKTNFPDAHPLIYELATDAWRPAAPPPVPGTDGIGPPAFAHDGVAFVCNATQAACGGYSPEEDSWQTLELPPLEASFTYWPAWAITDRELVLFGLAGDGSTSDESIASALDMKTRTWSALPNDGAPSPRRGQSATWAGSSVLFWGGQVVDGPDPEQGWELKRP